MAIAPFGCFATALTHITVISLRLDYLLHALIFLPMMVLSNGGPMKKIPLSVVPLQARPFSIV